MIDYLGGFITLAYRNILFYFDAESHLMTHHDEMHELEVTIELEHLHQIKIPESKKIYCLAEIGP